jgi:hypothetical protein
MRQIWLSLIFHFPFFQGEYLLKIISKILNSSHLKKSGGAILASSQPINNLKKGRIMKTFTEKTMSAVPSALKNAEGRAGWILLWALGVPIPVLIVLYLLRGCT